MLEYYLVLYTVTYQSFKYQKWKIFISSVEDYNCTQQICLSFTFLA